MVNLQDTPTAGPLTATDLDAARQVSTGRIYRLDTHRPLPAGLDQQGRHQTREFGRAPWHDTVSTDFGGIDGCAVEGGKHADPVPTKTQQDRPGIGIALVLAPWLAGVIGWALYVRWAA